LKALFSSSIFDSGEHTITLFYAAHLAATSVWANANEALLGCFGNINYVNPYPSAMPNATAFGTDAYSGGLPCTTGRAGDWTASFLKGVGSATGSSRHFELANQTDGSQGGLTLPIPTVPAPTGKITIIKVTNPANSGSDVFNFTGDLGSFTLDTNGADATNP